VTLQRKPFIQPEGDVRLSHTGKSPRDEQKWNCSRHLNW
jgi:hypothetical protein